MTQRQLQVLVMVAGIGAASLTR